MALSLMAAQGQKQMEVRHYAECSMQRLPALRPHLFDGPLTLKAW